MSHSSEKPTKTICPHYVLKQEQNVHLFLLMIFQVLKRIKFLGYSYSKSDSYSWRVL